MEIIFYREQPLGTPPPLLLFHYSQLVLDFRLTPQEMNDWRVLLLFVFGKRNSYAATWHSSQILHFTLQHICWRYYEAVRFDSTFTYCHEFQNIFQISALIMIYCHYVFSSLATCLTMKGTKNPVEIVLKFKVFPASNNVIIKIPLTIIFKGIISRN